MRIPVISTLLFISAAASAYAEGSKETDALRDNLQACLDANAILYGTKSCHPPSELMPALYSSCETEENAIRDYLSRTSESVVVERAINILRERMSGSVIKLIVDAQIRNNCQ